MTKVVSPHLLDDVRNADSTAGRIAALRALKNDIIGHNQKKQAWTELGILPLLSDVLLSRRGVGRKADFHQTEEDEMCFQAITIIGSLALGMHLESLSCMCSSTGSNLSHFFFFFPRWTGIHLPDFGWGDHSLAALHTIHTLVSSIPRSRRPSNSQHYCGSACLGIPKC